MPCPSHAPWLDHSNYTWRRVQVMKLLIMQFSPTSCHFISLRSKYYITYQTSTVHDPPIGKWNVAVQTVVHSFTDTLTHRDPSQLLIVSKRDSFVPRVNNRFLQLTLSRLMIRGGFAHSSRIGFPTPCEESPQYQQPSPSVVSVYFPRSEPS
jgi:hypothetical protein